MKRSLYDCGKHAIEVTKKFTALPAWIGRLIWTYARASTSAEPEIATIDRQAEMTDSCGRVEFAVPGFGTC
jgi:hypothetical protein